VKRLIPQLHHAIDEYHSHSQPLGDHLTGGFEKSVYSLEKMIGSLEDYLALKAPTAPRVDSAAEASAAPASSSAPSAQTTASPAETAPSGDTAAGKPADEGVSAAAGETLVSGRVP
jgi:hypothetical protein